MWRGEGGEGREIWMSVGMWRAVGQMVELKSAECGANASSAPEGGDGSASAASGNGENWLDDAGESAEREDEDDEDASAGELDDAGESIQAGQSPKTSADSEGAVASVHAQLRSSTGSKSNKEEESKGRVNENASSTVKAICFARRSGRR